MSTRINYKAMSDEEIVALAQLGDKAAEEFIVSKYKSFIELRSVPYFMAGGDRDDIIQEGLIGLYKAVKSYDGMKCANFKTFAEVCAVRQMISAVKTSTRKKSSPLNHSVPIYTEDGELIPAVGKMADTKNVNPESIVIEKETSDGMDSMLSGVLSEFEAEVLSYYLSGLSYREIAQVLKKKPKAVDNALCRIKSKIEKFVQ